MSNQIYWVSGWSGLRQGSKCIYAGRSKNIPKKMKEELEIEKDNDQMYQPIMPC